MLRIIIIDDESLARNRIKKLLSHENDIEIVGECKNGLEAVKCIKEKHPDIIFLDVQMPELDGFQVLQEIKSDNIPVIIFVTAYDRYALKAFEVHAVDYLLKPFDDDRFYEALQHAKNSLQSKKDNSLQKKLQLLISDLSKDSQGDDSTNKKTIERIVIKSSGKINFIKIKDIIRIKAAGKYLSILTSEGEHLLRKTMNEIEEELDNQQFMRIHRSTIINIDYIKEMQTYYRGEYVVILSTGEKFPTSSAYKNNIENLLEVS